MDITYHDPVTGRETPAWLSEAVDQLLSKIRHKSVWDIVDFCLHIWAQKYPAEHKKWLADMKKYKANRKNRFSSTQNKSLRELTVMPRELNYLLDMVASDKIADYGPKKFYREFARRYPGFSPADSI